MTLEPEQFVGAWSLVDWRIEYGDGRATRPFGEDARGQLLYAADGWMSATVSSATRLPLGNASVRKASEAQKAAAFDGYFHYAGTWRVEGETVIHAVEFALNPDMVGTEQRRGATFDRRGRLTLSANEVLGAGSARQHLLIWERCSD